MTIISSKSGYLSMPGEERRGEERRGGEAMGELREVGWGQGMAFITYREEREGKKKEEAAEEQRRREDRAGDDFQNCK